jgi:serine/threonine protein phosphatase PrpC
LTSAESFIEVDYCQRAKHGQLISGDVFLSEKVKQEGRIVSVLSDGLGSGVKASVLASMTATMALKFAASAMDTRKSAEIIMDTLPICSVRKISYSTFTVVDMALTGETRIIEHGNPSFLLIRPKGELMIQKTEMRPKRWQDRVISFSSFEVQREDRIIFFSDGITQAGMGEYRTPLGWGLENVEEFVREKIDRYPFISARELSRLLVAKAEEVDGLSAKDDITCAVVYFRSPRQLLVMTGAPFNRAHDHDLAMMAEHTPGRKVICGGTTANIISRLLNRAIQIDMQQPLHSRIPPAARMEGFELVTEGTLTLGEVLRLLEEDFAPEDMRSNPAVKLAAMLLDSDIVKFAVGTRINEAHQDPNIPVELDLRRNIVKRISQLLESKYMKRVIIQYL